MVSPRVRLVEHKSSKIEKMKIFTTPLHTATSSKHPYGKLKTGREDPELDALLTKVSPKYRHLKKISDLDYYRDIFVPKLEKKPLKIVKDQNLALTLSCRRKIAIPKLTGQNFITKTPSLALNKPNLSQLKQDGKDVYRSSVIKQKPKGRVVLVYDDDSDWHKEIERSLFEFDNL